jgi:spoIIIJ-associated protein
MEMEVSVEAEYDPSERELRVMMEGGDMGILIGKRGQTLDSLQYLVSLVVNRETEGYLRVKLDTENYRERRKETLETLAKNISYKVKRTKHPVALEPMNPYERRIIHSALQNDRYVVTRSEGEDPYRHVVISLKKEVPYSGNATRKDRYPSRRDKNGAEMADGKKGGKKPYRSRNRSAQNHVPGAKNAQDAQSLSVRSENIGEQVVSTEEVVLVKTETTVVETITTGSETTES